jgi:branched-chain amino acid transport system permease protein
MLGVSPYWTSVLTLAGIYAVAGIGLQLALSSGQFSVMHAALLGVGAYTAGAMNVLFGSNFGISLVVAAIAAGLIGLAASAVLLPLDGLFFGIATLAIGQALSYAVQVVPNVGGPGGLAGVPLDTTPSLVLIVLIMLLALYLWARRQPWYLAMLAAGQDPSAAAALGISPTRARVAAFTVGSIIAGLAGGLYVHYVGLVQPTDLGFAAESQLLVFVVLGGVATPFGAVVGALGISSLLELLRVSSEDRYWLLGVALVVIMVLRPGGLLRRCAVEGTTGGATQPETRGSRFGSSGTWGSWWTTLIGRAPSKRQQPSTADESMTVPHDLDSPASGPSSRT